jgi:hypothetical protein
MVGMVGLFVMRMSNTGVHLMFAQRHMLKANSVELRILA